MQPFRYGVGVLILSLGVAVPVPMWAAEAEGAPGGSSERPPIRAERSSLFGAPTAPVGRVRFETATVVPEAVQLLHEDRHSVTFEDETGQPVTIVKPGHKLEGEITGIEDGVLLVSVSGKGSVRIRERDVVGLELRRPGSTAMGVLGALVGVPAGLLATGIVCIAVESCSQGALWVGMLGGAALGAAGAGAAEWQRVPIVRSQRVALTLQPASRGAGIGVTFGF